MNQAKSFAITCAHRVLACVLICSQAGWAAASQSQSKPKSGSPEAVVSKALDAVNHGRVDEFASAMEADSLEDFRTAVVATIDTAVQRVGEAKLLESFPGVKSAKALKTLDAPHLFAGVVRRLTSDPDMKKSLAKTQLDVFGHVDEGDDTAHVVYRTKLKFGETDIVRLNVATLRKEGGAWKMVIPEDFSGPTKQGGPPPGAIDISATKVEPLGHILDGNEALIVYRTRLPVGDSTVTKLAVMPLISRDPAFEAVKADNMPEVKKLLESRLGFRSTSAPAAAKGASNKKSTTARPKALAKAMPRTTKAPAKSKTRKAQPSGSSDDRASRRIDRPARHIPAAAETATEATTSPPPAACSWALASATSCAPAVRRSARYSRFIAWAKSSSMANAKVVYWEQKPRPSPNPATPSVPSTPTPA